MDQDFCSFFMWPLLQSLISTSFVDESSFDSTTRASFVKFLTGIFFLPVQKAVVGDQDIFVERCTVDLEDSLGDKTCIFSCLLRRKYFLKDSESGCAHWTSATWMVML